MSVKRMVVFGMAVFFGMCSSVSALIGEEVGKDFQPVSGYVITAMQGEYLVDLDASQRLAIGDIFAVVRPGEKIIHPVTRKVIGNLEKAKAYLQVTRIQSGYSYTRLLGSDQGTKIEAGDVVRRFQNLPALFWDYSGAGEAIFAELQSALPHLEWADYASAQASRPPVPAPPAEQRIALTFIYDGSRLEARDPYFRIIHTYGTTTAPTTAGRASSATPLVTNRGMKLQPLPAPVPNYAWGSVPQARPQGTVVYPQSAAQPAGVPYKMDSQPLYSQGGVVRYSAAFPGFQNVGELPRGIVMSDFVVVDGRRLMAATNGSTIYVFDLSTGLTKIAQGAPSYFAEILSVKWWKPAAGKELYLAMTAWREKEQKVVSALFDMEGNNLRLLQENIPHILGSVDHNGDGMPELLLAQKYDGKKFFGRDIYQCDWQDGKLETSAPSFPLPLDFTVIGCLYADITGDGQPEWAYVRFNILFLYSADGQNRIYESPKQMGGSLSVARFNLFAESNRENEQSEFAPFEVTPVAVDLDGDNVKELVVASAEKIAYGVADGLLSGVKSSWLGVIKFRDGMFVKGTIGEKMEIPLAGLTVTSNEILFIASQPNKLLGGKGTSYLLSFPLR
ncbi:MAG: hypothetical protein JXK94_01375 [Deltaproteobacteria bacterium]|nr:hypothetical protein [Deltaproteobacteria bacterium]